jgi:hypothetical protein
MQAEHHGDQATAAQRGSQQELENGEGALSPSVIGGHECDSVGGGDQWWKRVAATLSGIWLVLRVWTASPWRQTR